jgi:two-component system aerobic respiration control sensor histidine kinase ArcB
MNKIKKWVVNFIERKFCRHLSSQITELELKINTLKTELEQANAYLDNVIRIVPASIYWKDKNFVIRGSNLFHTKLAGFSDPKDVIGKTEFDFVWKDQANDIIEKDKKIMALGEGIRLEEKATLNDGAVHTFLTSKEPLRNQHQEIIGIIGISIDITDRKKIEEDLLIAKEKAEIASQAKDDFISNMQHDLRTPFAGIGGMANVLDAMSEEKYPEFREFTKIMIKSCEQWENVHHRIFDVLAVEQIAPIKIEPISISKEVKKMQDMLAATLLLKKIQCVLKPVPPELDMIETDALKFHLILSSLISNAVNFTEEGEVTVTVFNEHNYRMITVNDTGIGIPADKLEYIFDKFTKLSRSNKYGGNFKGVGLGLYTARSYANQLGATIHVDSQLGKGSTFYIKMPIKK